MFEMSARHAVGNSTVPTALTAPTPVHNKVKGALIIDEEGVGVGPDASPQPSCLAQRVDKLTRGRVPGLRELSASLYR